MAYVNIAEWVPEQVADWLRGLEDVIHPYIHTFVEKKVDGKRLLHLCPSDLLTLKIECIGHQEIILRGVELLCNIHYHLHQENVQSLALKISSKARSIFNELRIALDVDCSENSVELLEDRIKPVSNFDGSSQKNERVSTNILAGVADALSSVKVLVSWLHKPPFHGIDEYDDLKSLLVNLSISLATIAQRDAFAEKQSSVIKENCLKLAEIADKIIQESKDPMILQPACLEIATIKKRADDNLGISLVSSYEGVHQIAVLRTLSPAHNCGKLMGGDQIVQVNYQTVIGWTSLKVTHAMQENPTEVILTLKKCPRHINTHTKIYFKPIRLPSKKRIYSPWESLTGLTSHRFDLQSIPTLPYIKAIEEVPIEGKSLTIEPQTKSVSPPLSTVPANSIQSLNSTGSDITGITRSDQEESEFSDDAFMSDSDIGAPSSFSVRLFQPKPRSCVQRRATVPGSKTRPSISFDHILMEYCKEKRDFSIDLGILKKPQVRPHTYGAEKDNRLDWKVSKSLEQPDMPYIDESDAKENVDSGRESELSDKTSIGSHHQNPDPKRLSAEHPRLDKTISSPVYSDELDVDRSGELNTSDNSSHFHSHVKYMDCSSNTDSSLNASKVSKVSLETDCSSLRSCDLSDTSLISRDGITNVGETTKVDTEEESPRNIYVNSSANCHVRPHLVVNPLEISPVKATPLSRWDDLMANRRRISCRELGQGDQQGWLYRRRDTKGFLMSYRWVKRWCILKKNALYGYHTQESLTASSFVNLVGFHVSPAPELKSKKYAFKIYHRKGTTFYFSCDTAEERSRWMSQMGLSSNSRECYQEFVESPADDPCYSETDEELEEKVPKSPFLMRKENVPKVPQSQNQNNSTKLSGFKFLHPPKIPLGQPIATPNFRTYVRVRDQETPKSIKMESKESVPLKDIKRKNSFRERLRQIPASLTMDRKKGKQTSPKRICSSSKSENSLADKQLDTNINHSQSNVQLNVVTEHNAEPIYERRKSFEAIKSDLSTVGSRKGICPLDGVSSDGESADENWTNSLRSIPSKYKTPTNRIDVPYSVSEPHLKKVTQYYPVTMVRKEPMQKAFELSLSSSEQSLTNIGDITETPKRPIVPPRSKFLSPRELQLPSPEELQPKGKPPNLVISPSTDESESPRTPQMPAMGVPMIGKQRRTPNALSPREVFFSSNTLTHPPLTTFSSLPLSIPSMQTQFNGTSKILPHYPGMEYPPTFEPESYTLNCLPDKPSPVDPRKRSSSSLGYQSPSFNGSYINVGHVPSTIEESSTKGYHHQIYVTSSLTPDSANRSRSSNSSYQQMPSRISNHSTPTYQSSSESSFHSNSYLPMNSAHSSSEYINMKLPSTFEPKSGRK